MGLSRSTKILEDKNENQKYYDSHVCKDKGIK